MAQPRMTLATRATLGAFLADPTREYYGLEICEATGLPSGTVYPILVRLETMGWVESSWEDSTEREKAGRPRRRYYRLTSRGAEDARLALASTYRSGRKVKSLSPRPGLGNA